MTRDMMNLRALMEKSPDADFLREMIGWGAQRLMEVEVASAPALATARRAAAPVSAAWTVLIKVDRSVPLVRFLPREEDTIIEVNSKTSSGVFGPDDIAVLYRTGSHPSTHCSIY